tara:strand:- start:10942 stop:11970 length:1029 start_codon:yes stop_codon:yes gene_type:complete
MSKCEIRKYKEILICTFFLTLLGLSTACTSSNSENVDLVDQKISNRTEKSLSEIEIENTPVLPVTVIDDLGNEVFIKSVERIIPLDGSVAEVIFALGMGDNVVATDISATWPLEADKLPKIGYQRALNAEPIAAFSPTVLLGTEIAGPPQTIEDLRRLGYPVVIIPSNSDPKGPGEKIRAVANALGLAKRGEVLALELDEKIQSATQNSVGKAKPLVAVLYIRGKGTQLLLGRNSGIYWMIEAAGGANVADILDVDDYTPITPESLLVANPDLIVVPSAGLESVGGIEGLLQTAGISQTKAGISRSIFSYDDQLLLGNGPRTGDLLERLVKDFGAVELVNSD